MTLELTSEIAAGLESIAVARGISIEEYLKQSIERDTMKLSERKGYVDLPPDQWKREFRAWVASHADDNLPSLSDEDMSRENIYAERGL